jgi:hypothetical protein
MLPDTAVQHAQERPKAMSLPSLRLEPP